ncbi:MAG TPA: NDP-sugar synthase, partial [Acidimicrobiia bacterium]|nr:NDP-sugar synthase [Acidimicrobiia bacterium]
MPPPDSTPSPIRQAVLLVGGRGTRMWPLTATIPKGLLPLGGIPFVEYQLRQLSRLGIEEVFLALGRNLLDDWKSYAASSPLGLRLHLAIEDEPLDTAGPVRAILDRLEERFLVLNGDVVIEADLGPLVGASGTATLGLVEVDDTSAYGVVVAGGDGKVAAFVEKPPTATAPARTVNAGMYSLTTAALAAYPIGPLSFERVVFPALVAAGSLDAVVLSGRWIDIGTPDLYLAAHAAVHGGDSALHRPAAAHQTEGAAATGTRRGAWSWVGPGAEVAADAVVEEAVVLAGARLADGAVVRRAIIGPGAVIESGTIVTGSAVVGSGAVIGAGCE